MATQTVTQAKPKRLRRISLNGRIVKKMAGNFPLFIQRDDGTLDELTNAQRALLRFYRALPDDLRPQFLDCFKNQGVDLEANLRAFQAKLEPRKSELKDWSW